jgi:hypothetical protein
MLRFDEEGQCLENTRPYIYHAGILVASFIHARNAFAATLYATPACAALFLILMRGRSVLPHLMRCMKSEHFEQQLVQDKYRRSSVQQRLPPIILSHPGIVAVMLEVMMQRCSRISRLRARWVMDLMQ